MTDIVTLSGDTAVTTSLTIAENTDNEHKSVIQLVRTYVDDLEEFGLVRFEMRPRLPGQHGGGNTEYAELNEQQATLLLTYMRNTDIVRFFKKRLVRAFFEMAQRLAAANTTRAGDPMAILANPAAMRGLLLTYTEKVIDLQHTVEEQAPKVAALQRLEDAEGSFGLREAAHRCWTCPSASSLATSMPRAGSSRCPTAGAGKGTPRSARPGSSLTKPGGINGRTASGARRTTYASPRRASRSSPSSLPSRAGCSPIRSPHDTPASHRLDGGRPGRGDCGAATDCRDSRRSQPWGPFLRRYSE